MGIKNRKYYKQGIVILFNEIIFRKVITVYRLYYFFILVKYFLPRTLETPLLPSDASFVGKQFSCKLLYNNSASFLFGSISFSSSCDHTEYEIKDYI